MRSCEFLLNTDRTSCVNLKASKKGRRFNRAVSPGSAIHDDIGMALSLRGDNKSNRNKRR